MLPNNKKLFEGLLKGLQKSSNSPTDLVSAILQCWLETSYPSLTRPSVEARLLQEPIVTEFATWLSGLDLMTSAFWLSTAYASLTGNEVRKRHSLFFTSPYLASQILDNAGGNLLRGKIIDPACGGAAFLAPAAERISRELTKRGNSSEQIIEYLERNLYGCDSDTFLCELSATFLKMVLVDHIVKAGREPIFNIRLGDGLTAFKNDLGSFKLVLCNPPYKKLTREELAPYLELYADILKGQPNLYALFMRRAMHLLKANGTAVLLTPMSFLSGQYFSKLRQTLADEGRVQQLDLIHEKTGVFLGAEQDSIISVWRKRDKDSAKPTSIYLLSSGSARSYMGELVLSKADTPWPVPRTNSDNELLNLFKNPSHSLSSWGYKPKTGTIVIHRDKRRRYKQIHANSSAILPLPLIWATDIGVDGVLHLNARGRNESNFVDMESASCISIVRRPAIAMQRVTSNDQKRRLICAPIPSELCSTYGGVVGENHVCLIEKTVASSTITPEFLTAILKTETMDRLFRCISGATNVSAYELMRLPLPDPHKIEAALKSGKNMEEAVRVGFGLPIFDDQKLQLSENNNLGEYKNVGEDCCT